MHNILCALSQVGDILFIKGAKYGRGEGKGGDGKPLIHKSPDVCYRADGSPVTRLCLKVDAIS